jgi:hypothetical protein
LGKKKALVLSGMIGTLDGGVTLVAQGWGIGWAKFGDPDLHINVVFQAMIPSQSLKIGFDAMEVMHTDEEV